MVALDDHTTGAITATISDNDAATLVGLSNDNSNNVLTISLTDGTVDAANLNTINALTAGTFTVSSTTVNGAAGAIHTAYTAGGITGLGNETVTATSGTLTVTQANAVDDATSGVITATISNGDATTLKTLTDDNSNNVYLSLIHI